MCSAEKAPHTGVGTQPLPCAPAVAAERTRHLPGCCKRRAAAADGVLHKPVLRWQRSDCQRYLPTAFVPHLAQWILLLKASAIWAFVFGCSYSKRKFFQYKELLRLLTDQLVAFCRQGLSVRSELCYSVLSRSQAVNNR